MADTTALKNRIRAVIKTNDNQEITGPVLQQALLDIVDELNGATETEASQRQSTDGTLAGAINTERNRAQEAENTLSQRITTEKNRAEEAESTLQQNITAEKNRAEEAESTLQQNITAEKNRAEEAESTLQQSITAEKNRAEEAEDALGQRISNETTRAKGAENALGRRISDETSRAEEAIRTVANTIESETTRAEEAESALQQNITAEKNRAEGAESTLQQNITAEKNRAKEAENALGQRILTAIDNVIDTTHLTNPTDKSLAKAEDVVPIKGAVRELNYSEIKSTQTPITDYYVNGSTGNLVQNSNSAYVEIDVSTVDKVRFSELIVIPAGYNSGFSFGHYDNGVYVNDYSRAWTRDTSSGATSNYIIDSILNVPEKSTVFRCTSKTSTILNENTFYCYLISGSGAVSKNYVDSYLFDEIITNNIDIPKRSSGDFELPIQQNTWLGQHSINNAGSVYVIDLSDYPHASELKISKDSNTPFFFITKKKLPTTIPDGGIDYTTLNSEYTAQCQIPNHGSEYRTQIQSEDSPLTVKLSYDAKYVYIGRAYTGGTSTSWYRPSSIVVGTQKINGGILGKLEDIESLNPVSSNKKQISLGIDDNLTSSTLEFNNNYADDVVVYEGLTLTDIFEKNNLIPIYPGFDNGEYIPMRASNGNPQITSTECFTGNCSLCVNDVNTISSQLCYPSTGNFYSSGLTYFAAFKVKVTSYTQGKIGINIGSTDTAQLFLQRTTDGWETVSGDLTSGKSAMFIGGFTSSKLVGYIDSPVLISKGLFKTIPTVEQFTNLYEQYISYKMSSKNVSINTNKVQRYTDSECLARFIQEMNARALRIGMSNNTIFTSVSGFDTTLNSNRSTARDYIKLMIEAMYHDKLMTIWGKPSWILKFYDASADAYATKTLESTVCNPNHQSDMPALLAAYNILGGKTGTIGAGELLPSGRSYHNYCVVAEKNGKYVIAVLFGGDYVGTTYGDKRYAKMKILLDNAFGLLNDPSYQTQTVLDKPSADYLCSCAACEVPQINPSMLQNFTPTLLYSENPDLQVYIASTTKIMTCLLAEELININQKLLYRASDDIGGSGNDLDAGDIATFEQMMADTMLPSSNGCAQCIGKVAGRYLLEFENDSINR